MIYIEKINGINEEGLDLLIKEFYNSIEAVNKVFVNVSDLIVGTNDYFKCDNGDLLRKRFDEFKMNFGKINKKLLSYSDYLANVKITYQNLNIDSNKNINDKENEIINTYGKEDRENE